MRLSIRCGGESKKATSLVGSDAAEGPVQPLRRTNAVKL